MPNPSFARILVVTNNGTLMSELASAFASNGCDCVSAPNVGEASATIQEHLPDLLLVDMGSFQTPTDGQAFSRKLKQESRLPVIAILSENTLKDFDPTSGIDDFAVKPCKPAEIVARVKQVLWQTSNIDSDNLIKHGDLVVDLVKYEVSVAGRVIDLSFKEYELLKILVSNKGRVLTRQALLDKVWGYDYYGGDRTVDVHIRRLRSKIEDANHSFVQTVRNVGYKFKD